MKDRTANFSSTSDIEKKRLIESAFIMYPRLKKLEGMIEHCHQHSKISVEPWCMLISGWAGAGKTKLFQSYERRFPRGVTEGGIQIPVLSARIPQRPTVKSLVTILLYNLGDPLAEKGATIVQTLRLYHLLKECQVELIILDEFQHFVDWDSSKILRTVSDWLKNLIDESGVPVILIGMPYSDVVLNAVGNSQLKRRFSLRQSLDFFGWKTNDEKKDFRSFLKVVDEHLPLTKPSNFADLNTAYRFYCASNGVVAYVMKIVRRAACIAVDQAAEAVSLNMLEVAYDELIMPEDRRRKNPFSIDVSQLSPTPFEYVTPVLGATSNRVKAKERKTTAIDVLR